MEIKGMTPVRVAEAMPTDQRTYLFIDSKGYNPGMYVDPKDREFAISIGYDFWLRPESLFDVLIPNKDLAKINLESNSGENNFNN